MDQFDEIKKAEVLSDMEKARKVIAEHPGIDSKETREAHRDMCCAYVILIIKNYREGEEEWLTGPMAKSFVEDAEVLLSLDDKESDTADYLQSIYNCLSYLTDYISERPRLLARLYRMNVEVIARLGSVVDADGNGLTKARKDVEWVEANIKAADEMRYNDIVNRSHLKHDPLEWTREWEDVIDDVDVEAYKKLGGYRRGMGFCFAFWSARHTALRKRGLSWRDPQMMNPGVMFD